MARDNRTRILKGQDHGTDETDWRIDVLDENFLQPYDYQAMLERNTTNPIPHKVKEDVEYWMQHLTDKGVISGHNYGEYI